MTLKHTTLTVSPDDGTSDVSADEWNEDHTISGTSLALQYNNAGSLSEMSGTSWDNTNRSLTITGATITANAPMLDLSQTWNNAAVTFTGLKCNITKSAAGASSLLMDVQMGGITKMSLKADTNSILELHGGLWIYKDTSAAQVGFGTAFDTAIERTSAGVLEVNNGTTGVYCALKVSTLTVSSKVVGATKTITAVIDGGGSAITTGIKGDIVISEACTITSATLIADQSGSIVVDVWKDTYANFPPTVADTITAAAKPTLSTATKSQDTTLTGWTTSIAAGDILRFNVDSATTVTRVTLALKVVTA